MRLSFVFFLNISHRIFLCFKAYKIVFRSGLTLNEAIEIVVTEVEQTPEVINFVNFIKSSERGITR